jgi:hypothetical protein
MNLTPSQIEELRSLLARCGDAPMSQAEIERLNELLAADSQAQQMFADYAMLDACLEMVWNDADEQEIGDFANESACEEETAPIVIQASPVLHASLSSLHLPLGGLMFSYSVAAVVVAVGLLVGWACHVSLPVDRQDIAGKNPPSTPVPAHRESSTVSVALITGMVDCRWVDPHEAPVGFDRIALGRKYALISGLMEISYDTGARVILQGPCEYEVCSEAGGYLVFGKSTARIEKKDSEKPGRDLSKPTSLELFSIRTPTATVVDLGTEFGVEVDKSGASMTHVYQGKVELRVGDGTVAKIKAVSLNKGESARVKIGKSQAPVVVRQAAQANRFVRQMPKRDRIKAFNTGVNLKDGQQDPHWQVVARSDEPNFKPRPAIVSGTNNSMWLANQVDRSQWISLIGGDSVLPEGVVYTFRTTFDLTGMRLSTAILQGRFVVDNRLKAIRVNGSRVPVPAHGDEQFGFFHGFSINKGFVDGVNVIEFDVENGADRDMQEATPMGLLVELEGSALSDWPEAAATDKTDAK